MLFTRANVDGVNDRLYVRLGIEYAIFKNLFVFFY